MEPFNYLTQENGAMCTYLLPTGAPRDLTDKLLCSTTTSRPWMSSSTAGFPHVLHFDLSGLGNMPTIKRDGAPNPGYYRAFGLSCWHAYPSNPAVLKMYISRDGRRDWVHWQTIQTEMAAGTQVFKLREKINAQEVRHIKVEIVRTHGDPEKTYINQVFLYDKYVSKIQGDMPLQTPCSQGWQSEANKSGGMLHFSKQMNGVEYQSL